MSTTSGYPAFIASMALVFAACSREAPPQEVRADEGRPGATAANDAYDSTGPYEFDQDPQVTASEQASPDAGVDDGELGMPDDGVVGVTDPATERAAASVDDPAVDDPVVDDPAVDDPAMADAASGSSVLEIGRGLAGDGSIAEDEFTSEFAAGSPIFLAMQVEGAADSTPVRIVWYGPNDVLLGESMKVIAEDDQYLNFRAENNEQWTPGEYRAEVFLGEEKIGEQTFSVVDARQALGEQADGETG